jgi:hypothetical protein
MGDVRLKGEPLKSIICMFTIAVLTYAMPFAAIGKEGPKESKVFRLIPIPKREHGYGSMDSVVIRTKGDLAVFLKSIQGQTGWNNRMGFEDAISNAKVNFEKEALVLLRHTEGSGSVQVTFHKPAFRVKKLTCRITRKEPEIGTADMAYYCFALAVSKSAISKVELQVAGRKSLVLLLVGKHSNKVAPTDNE